MGEEELNQGNGAWPFWAILVSLLNATWWALQAYEIAFPALRDWRNPGAARAWFATGFLVIGFALSVVGPVWLMRRRKPRTALAFAVGLIVLYLTGIWLWVRLYGT
jgi:cation transport ATPase